MDCLHAIGINIRNVRCQRGLSQQALAVACGFSNTTLSSYENGKKTPGLFTIATIAKNLGVSIERLYYGDENNSFISSVSDDGRKIVNSVFLLWSMNVITYHDNVPHVLGLNNMYEAEADNSIVSLSNHIMPILRLLKSLHEFSMNKDTFTDPDAYLEMLFSSVAAEINKENSNEKLRSAKTASV